MPIRAPADSKTEVYRGVKVTTHRVRWKVGGRLWRRSFRTAAQADSFRAELLAAARRGEAFVVQNGLSASWQRNEPWMSWYGQHDIAKRRIMDMLNADPEGDEPVRGDEPGDGGQQDGTRPSSGSDREDGSASSGGGQ